MKEIPEASPLRIVARTGVLTLSLIFEKNLKISPSDDIAYKILGSGKNEPKMLENMSKRGLRYEFNRYRYSAKSNLEVRLQIAPIATTYPAQFQPLYRNASGSGEFSSIMK